MAGWYDGREFLDGYTIYPGYYGGAILEAGGGIEDFSYFWESPLGILDIS